MRRIEYQSLHILDDPLVQGRVLVQVVVEIHVLMDVEGHRRMVQEEVVLEQVQV
jgi:hypothetical protein